MKKLLATIAITCMVCAAWAEEPAEETKHWTKNGNASLQFTQGFVSKNWYKGGESNFALLATGDYTFNYKRNKFAWDNKIEAKLGFITTPSDEYHSYMTNNDLLKWTTKLGYQASENWYYTIQGIGETQFVAGYKSNVEQKTSKAFNPAYLNLSTGMDYKKETENVKFSCFIGPFAYNLKFIGDPLRGDEANPKGEIDGSQFGLQWGDFNLYDLGASAKATLTWKICKYVTWNSQATYFSPLYKSGANYKGNGYTLVDWENTFDMPLNKFFSTKVYTHLRFDDSAPAKFGDWGYFQFTELLSFGISYNW